MEYLPTSFIHVIKTWKFLILSAFIVCYLYRFAHEQILGLNSFVSAADKTETFSISHGIHFHLLLSQTPVINCVPFIECEGTLEMNSV